MGLKVVEGRDFSVDRSGDSEAAIINQTLAEGLGLNDPVGKRIKNGRVTYTVIGMVENFNFESLKQEIAGLCLVLGKSPDIVSVKVNTSDMSGAIHSICPSVILFWMRALRKCMLMFNAWGLFLHHLPCWQLSWLVWDCWLFFLYGCAAH
jgi:MacB-like periplasmic core domain